MISLPRNVLDVGRGLFQKNEALLLRDFEIPTSVKNMDPENPFIKTLASIPLPPEVKGHSIIAVKGNGPVTEGNDGVVEYASAHIDGVESEYIVFSGHSCQSNPFTILEVRRILLEHWRTHFTLEEWRRPWTPAIMGTREWVAQGILHDSSPFQRLDSSLCPWGCRHRPRVVLRRR